MVLRRFAHAEGGIPCSLRGGSKEAFSRCEGGVNARVWVQREVGARHAAELPLHQHLLSAEGKLRLLPVAGRQGALVPWVPAGPSHKAAHCGWPQGAANFGGEKSMG